MTTRLPDPLIAAEVDLRDFQFLPLDVVRLRDSDLVSLETAESFRAAVLLWCASWHQQPAASLPDDDRVLAKLAGYGFVVDAWLAERSGALRGWVKCSDGRLYHPVVAEKAREAWRGKLVQRWKTECSRIKKHNQRHGTNHDCPEFDAWVSSGCPSGQVPAVPATSPPLSPKTGEGQTPSVPGETGSKGQGEGQGQGQGQGIETPTPPPPDDAHDPPPESLTCIADFSNYLTRRGMEPTAVRSVKARSVLQAWADEGVTRKALDAAYTEAERTLRGAAPGSPSYIDVILKRLSTSPASQPARRSIHDERAATIAAATGADRQRPERDITADSSVVG